MCGTRRVASRPPPDQPDQAARPAPPPVHRHSTEVTTDCSQSVTSPVLVRQSPSASSFARSSARLPVRPPTRPEVQVDIEGSTPLAPFPPPVAAQLLARPPACWYSAQGIYGTSPTLRHPHSHTRKYGTEGASPVPVPFPLADTAAHHISKSRTDPSTCGGTDWSRVAASQFKSLLAAALFVVFISYSI